MCSIQAGVVWSCCPRGVPGEQAGFPVLLASREWGTQARHAAQWLLPKVWLSSSEGCSHFLFRPFAEPLKWEGKGVWSYLSDGLMTDFFFLFVCLFVCFGASAQQCSGFTPLGAWGTIWGTGEQTPVSPVQGQHHPHPAVFPALVYWILINASQSFLLPLNPHCEVARLKSRMLVKAGFGVRKIWFWNWPVSVSESMIYG